MKWFFRFITLLLLVTISLVSYAYFRTSQNEAVLKNLNGKMSQLIRTAGGDLELAAIRVDENFYLEDRPFDFDLGTVTKIDAQVPIIYRYHVTLRDAWQFHSDGKKLTIIAPQLRLTDPPGVLTDEMHVNINQGFWRYNGIEMQSFLISELRPRSIALGNSYLTTPESPYGYYIREGARQTIKEFVSDWLAHEYSLADFEQIEVRFDDEEQADLPKTPPGLFEQIIAESKSLLSLETRNSSPPQ